MNQQRIEGFTLLELLVAIAIIGVLAAIAIPQYRTYRENALAAACASELRSFASAFYAYMTDNEEFPPDSHLNLPPGMETLIAQSVWSAATPIGGTYNWEGPDGYPYAGISVFQHTAPNRILRLVDALLDNGNLATGRFRVMGNGRPTYVLEE